MNRNRNFAIDGRSVDKREIETVTFYVRGSGRFPFDMLRRDRCWPLDEGESYKLLADDDDSGTRLIALAGLSYPTTGRWASFGWKVFERPTAI